MDINKYSGYFHDGTLIGINRLGNNVEFLLESSQIEVDEFFNREVLSKSFTLKGKLHVINIRNIKINNISNKNILSKEYDDGEILDLEIHNNKMLLLIEWTDYPPKNRVTDVSKIEIEADKIYWENIPTLSDQMP